MVLVVHSFTPEPTYVSALQYSRHWETDRVLDFTPACHFYTLYEGEDEYTWKHGLNWIICTFCILQFALTSKQKQFQTNWRGNTSDINKENLQNSNLLLFTFMLNHPNFELWKFRIRKTFSIVSKEETRRESMV